MSETRDPLAGLKPGSRTYRLCSLRVGESMSEAVLIRNGTAPAGDLQAQLNELKNDMTTNIRRATERSDMAFTLATGSFRTNEWDTAICVVVTRTK